MREFEDQDGKTWVATVQERPGPDYKGRYYFFVHPKDGSKDDEIALLDVRWNSVRTAERTLRTMSEVELRRRLRQALGRGRSPMNPPG